MIPEPLRTPELELPRIADGDAAAVPANDEGDADLPAFLAEDGGDEVGDPDAIAAE